MATSGIMPKAEGDIYYAYDVNQSYKRMMDIYNYIFIGSLGTGSPIGSTITLDSGCRHFSIYNEGAVNAYVVFGSPASWASGMYLPPSENLIVNISGANQISALIISGGCVLKYIAQY